MFPENPPEYGVASYAAQTGEQHPVNSQLLQESDIITRTFFTRTFWRRGPSKKKRTFKPASAPTTMSAKHRGSPFQPVTAKQMELTLLETERLTPPTDSHDLSDDSQDYETTDGEEDSFDDEASEEEQEEEEEVKKEETDG